MDGEQKEGEQGIFPLTIRPNQSLLVEELKSKFENIDRRFDSLFEGINNNGSAAPVPNSMSNTESQLICNQISEVLEQWSGRRTQNYFELKHISQLLKAFLKNIIMEMASTWYYRELGKSLLPVKRHGTLSGKPLFLAILGSVLTPQKFPFVHLDHFGEAVDLGCEVQSLEKQQTNLPTINNCFQVSNSSSLNYAITLDK